MAPEPCPRPGGPAGWALGALALACWRRPRLVLGLAWLGVVAGLSLAWGGLRLNMDWSGLFGEQEALVQRVARARAEFPYPEDVAVLVDGGTPAQREAYLERLAARLEAEPDRFPLLFYRFEADLLRRAALFYLSEEQLGALLARARALAPTLDRLREARSLPELIGLLERGLPPGGELDVEGLRALERVVADLERCLESRGRVPPRPLWDLLLPPEVRQRLPISPDRLLEPGARIYTTLDGGRIHLLVVKANLPGRPQELEWQGVERIREILAELRATAWPLRVRMTGLPVLLHDERQTVEQDTLVSTLLCLALVTCLLRWGFGGWRRPLLAVSSLLVGLGWTMGFTTLAVGQLNYMTVTYLSILMGLGIDFAIHLLFRFSEERLRGAPPERALVTTMACAGVDVAVGASATAAAFGVIALVGFRGVAELGVIGAGGILLCLLATLTVLPAGLAILPGAASPRRVHGLGRLGEALEEAVQARPGIAVGAGALLTALLLASAARVPFDRNLLNMQAPDLESIRTERQMIRETDTTVLTATSLAPSLGEARRLGARYRELAEVAGVHGLGELLPVGGALKEAQVAELRRLLRGVDGAQLRRWVTGGGPEALEQTLGWLERSWAQGSGRSTGPLRGHLAAIRAHWEGLGPGALSDGFTAFRDAWVGEVELLARFLRDHRARPPGPADLPSGLRERLIGRTGQIPVNVIPRENLWEGEPRGRFLLAARRVDPEVVGHPVVMDYIVTRVDEAHRIMSWASLGAVLVVMGGYLRRPRVVLLAALPTALGLVWMLGLMGWRGLPFNAANFVAVPMLVGIGAIFGVHVVHRMEEEGGERILACSTGPALLLSALTTVVGFGSLMVAHHQGIASLGFVISAGVGANLVVSLFLLPAAVRWWWRARARREAGPR